MILVNRMLVLQLLLQYPIYSNNYHDMRSNGLTKNVICIDAEFSTQKGNIIFNN